MEDAWHSPSSNTALEGSAVTEDGIYDGPGTQVAPDLLSLQTLIANVCFIGTPGAAAGEWVLVDTGLAISGEQILKTAEERFGPDRPPGAIILTHGHFDHIGSARRLAEHWSVPIYAHEKELPYLTGAADYPPPDPTVGGGLLALVSPLYPNDAVDLGEHLRPLPGDGSLPGLPGWRWIATPGHTPGHLSLFREADRLLISGDAFITVKQESAIAVLLQEKEIHGPPAYFTSDWIAARESVRRLAALNPSAVAPGHGRPMYGQELAHDLQRLADEFDRVAVPEQGRYVPSHLPDQGDQEAFRPHP